MSDCIFCRIAAGEVPTKKVDETEHGTAFRELNPQVPSHVLLIPKQHAADSAEWLRPEHGAMLAELFGLASRVARSEGLGGGWRLVTNVGPDAGQSVFHLHFHLLGGRPMSW